MIDKPIPRLPRDLPLTRLLPNMLTLMSLCSGLTGMRFALLGKWHEAVLTYVIAAVFDMLDGRVARLLNITSKFGAELDSLADAVSFGVAPGFILYEWTLKNGAGSLGWIAVLAFSVCNALRLARFNTMLEDQDHVAPAWAKGYFTGVPAPGGAGLALWPLAVYLEFGDAALIPPVALAFWLMLIGGLMVSGLPTLAMKGWRVPRVWVTPIYVILALAIAALVTNPWLTLSGAGAVYLLSLPVGWYSYWRKLKREGAAG
jgi:CDP-diacylglycerol--serine O-phosphatidyltransferase